MLGDSKQKAAQLRRWSGAFPFAEIGRLLFVIAIVQVVFWTLGNGVLFVRGHSEFPEFTASDFSAARVASPARADVDAAKFEPVEIPGWYGCCDPGYWAVRYSLEIPVVPEEGLGFLPQIAADNFEVRINGQIAVKRGSIEWGKQTYHANDRRIEFIPAGVVRAGRNAVEYIIVRDAAPYYDVGPPVFGARSDVERAYAHQAFLLGPFELICIVTGFLMTGFVLVVLIQSESKSFPSALLLLTFAWTLKAHFYSWSEPFFGGMGRLYYYFVVTALVPIAWLNFADEWTGQPLRWVKMLCVGAGVLAAAVLAYCLWFMPRDQGFDRASELVNMGAAALMVLTLARFAWHVVRHGDNRRWEVAIFVLLLTLAGIEFAYEVLWQEATGYLARSMPLLILAMTVAVFARSIRLFRSADQINQVLTVRLTAREAELDAAHRRERDLVRQQAHGEERQRILRDMHDGLGSQLMSMLLAARRGEAKPDQVAEGLQSVIDEMRLMIASMDSVGESLFAALSLFRDRMSQRITATGFGFEWQNTFSGEYPDYGPRPTLQVFRILQEAVTNALKHSSGDLIRVVIAPRPAGAGGLRITVSDNGGAKRAQAPVVQGSGRGLTNMNMRAAAIGASLSIEQTAEGLSVVLDLPDPAAESSAMQAAE